MHETLVQSYPPGYFFKSVNLRLNSALSYKLFDITRSLFEKSINNFASDKMNIRRKFTVFKNGVMAFE